MKPVSLKPAAKQNRKMRTVEPVSASSSVGAGVWRMPGGLGLTEFAWSRGFAAPSLMKRNELGRGERL